MDDAYRIICSEPENWWHFIEEYKGKLRTIGVYVDSNRLSRKTHQYMSKRKRDRDLNRGRVRQLEMPLLQSDNWAREFETMNPDWMGEMSTLHNDLASFLKTSYQALEVSIDTREQRLLSTRVYFCANRLTRLGFSGVEDIIVQILRDQPWIIRQPQHVIKALANQAYSSQILELLSYNLTNPHQSSHYFVGMLIHALRFVPNLGDDELQVIIQIATDESRHTIERLLATETWIRVGCSQVEENALKIIEVLKNEKSIRLRKNYVLLLGKYLPEMIGGTEGDQDSLLQSAQRIALNGEVDNLYATEEPDIIRIEYYSGEYPDDSREFNEMGY